MAVRFLWLKAVLAGMLVFTCALLGLALAGSPSIIPLPPLVGVVQRLPPVDEPVASNPPPMPAPVPPPQPAMPMTPPAAPPMPAPPAAIPLALPAIQKREAVLASPPPMQRPVPQHRTMASYPPSATAPPAARPTVPPQPALPPPAPPMPLAAIPLSLPTIHKRVVTPAGAPPPEQRPGPQHQVASYARPPAAVPMAVPAPPPAPPMAMAAIPLALPTIQQRAARPANPQPQQQAAEQYQVATTNVEPPAAAAYPAPSAPPAPALPAPSMQLAAIPLPLPTLNQREAMPATPLPTQQAAPPNPVYAALPQIQPPPRQTETTYPLPLATNVPLPSMLPREALPPTPLPAEQPAPPPPALVALPPSPPSKPTQASPLPAPTTQPPRELEPQYALLPPLSPPQDWSPPIASPPSTPHAAGPEIVFQPAPPLQPAEVLPLTDPNQPKPPLAPAEVIPAPNPQNALVRSPLLPEETSIRSITTSIAATQGKLPANIAAERFSQQQQFVALDCRPWEGQLYQWDAPAFCHRPLRFEQVNFERYGYTKCRLFAPTVSAAHFIGSSLALPYSMALHPPRECMYALGYYRPGSPAPYRYVRPEWSVKAAATEMATVTGLIFFIP